MNVLGVGLLEILLILILGLLVLGPKGMIKAAKLAGKYLHKLYQSEFWKLAQGSRTAVEKYTRELQLTGEMEKIKAELSQLDPAEKEGLAQGSPPPANQKKRTLPDQEETETALEESDSNQESEKSKNNPG